MCGLSAALSLVLGNVPARAQAVVTVATGFNQIQSLVFGADNALYIADRGAGEVYRLPFEGVVAPFAALPGVTGLAFDPTGFPAGRLYAAAGSHLSTIDAAGTVTPLATTGAGLPVAGALASDPAGNVYMLGQNALAKITGTQAVTLVSGLSVALGVAADANGSVYIGQASIHRLDKVDANTGAELPGFPIAAGTPDSVAVSPVDGRVYVINRLTNHIDIYTPAGVSAGSFASGLFNIPFGLAFDPRGNLYVGNFGNGSVVEILFNPPPPVPASTPWTLGATALALAALGIRFARHREA